MRERINGAEEDLVVVVAAEGLLAVAVGEGAGGLQAEGAAGLVGERRMHCRVHPPLILIKEVFP